MTTERRRASLPTPGQLSFSLMCAFSLILILRNSDAAIEYMGSGLRLCVRTVIPALFPFMVISELIVSSGIGEWLGRFLDRPVRWLFGVSGASAPAVILGALCGFPLGARSAAALLDEGLIGRREASRLLTFCNNPSSAFIINAVGVSLYQSRKLGMILYAVTLVNAMIIGIVQRLCCPPIKKSEFHHKVTKYASGIELFTSSVTRSAEGMLNICAYIVFFSAIVGCISALLAGLGSPPPLSAFIHGLVELSGGIGEASALGGNIAGICISAFIIGWSGLSVHFQIISVSSGRGIGYRGYFIAKAAQGIMNAAAMLALCRLCPALTTPEGAKEAVLILPPALSSFFSAAMLAIFSLALPAALTRLLTGRRRGLHRM